MITRTYPLVGPVARTTRAEGPADFARLGVLVALVASGVVLFEPAPCDLLLIALVAVLPLCGVCAFNSRLVLGLVLWLACGAGAVIASGLSLSPMRSLVHTGVSLYLYVASFVLAGFIAFDPVRHGRLVMNALVGGALIAATAGIVGYFSLFPGAFELFTKFGRAAGTFKDPNVLGAFLVPALLWLVHLVVERPGRRSGLLPLAGAGFVGLAVLLSFSRGAWINLAVALVLWGYLAWVTAPDEDARARILRLGSAAIASVSVLLVVASQLDAVAGLLAERSSLMQGYDMGPEGRFGGHEKAKALVLASPLGIGAVQFGGVHHHEDVHNVYISMFLNAGWLGGTLYLFAIGLTVVVGLLHVLRNSAARPIFLVAFAAFVGNVVEGVVIDTDHWRHFYVLLALVWGLVAAEDRLRAGGRT